MILYFLIVTFLIGPSLRCVLGSKAKELGGLSLLKRFIVGFIVALMVVTGTSAQATHQAADPNEPCGPANGQLAVWTKKIHTGDQIKFYAKYPQLNQKIQFMVQNEEGDYEEFAWLRVDPEDLTSSGDYKSMQNEVYFVRTLDLRPGKNRLRILVDGEMAWGTTTYVPSTPTKPQSNVPNRVYERGYFCGLGSASSDESPQGKSDAVAAVSPSEAPFSLSGAAQKGPLVFGSRVWVSELDENLGSNGRTFMTQIEDFTGNFSLSAEINTNLVEIVATGYYFDEIAGSLSTGPITLNAIADLSIDSTPTVNILTTLQAPRLKSLIRGGMGYTAAQEQSTRELLSVFGIDPGDIENFSALHAMSLNGTQDQDSVLLAATAIVSQVASDRASRSSSNQAAEMSLLLSDTSGDLAGNGSVGQLGTLAEIQAASVAVDLEDVRNNLEGYYRARGVSITTPLFEEWVDKDASGVLPQRRVSIPGTDLSDLTDQPAYQRVTSDVIRIGSLETGESAQVSVSSGSTIFKNGLPIAGRFTTVQNGDELFLSTETLGLGETKVVTLNVGSSRTTWEITTENPTLLIENETYGVGCTSGASSDPRTHFAIPIRASKSATEAETVTFSYAGLGAYWFDYFYGSAGELVSMSIHSDNAGEPGAELAAAENTRSLSQSRFFESSDLSNCGATGPQGYFGETGLTIQANDVYWIVIELSEPTAISAQGLHAPNYLPFTEDEFSTVYQYGRLQSADGNTWERWDGASNMAYWYNLPSWFLAN